MNLTAAELDIIRKIADTETLKREERGKNIISVWPLAACCRDCGELLIVQSGWDTGAFEVFPGDYTEQYVEESYCANCDTIHQTWRRQKRDSPYEQVTLIWRKNCNGGFFCSDRGFEGEIAGTATAEAGERFNSQDGMQLAWRAARLLSGPRMVPDAPILIVVLPQESESRVASDIEQIEASLRRKREPEPFAVIANGTYVLVIIGCGMIDGIWKLRRNRDISPVTQVWKVNPQGMYEVREWDWQSQREVVPSLVKLARRLP